MTGSEVEHRVGKPCIITFWRSFSALLVAEQNQSRFFSASHLPMPRPVMMIGLLWSFAANKPEAWKLGLRGRGGGLPSGPVFPW